MACRKTTSFFIRGTMVTLVSLYASSCQLAFTSFHHPCSSHNSSAIFSQWHFPNFHLLSSLSNLHLFNVK
jgi:hypothetical protein